MPTLVAMKSFCSALLCVLVLLAYHALDAKTVVDRDAAPADEYFGPQKMSALGIRMRVDALGREYHARTIADGDLLHDAAIAEGALQAWNRRYPRDSWLAPTAFHLEQLYAEVQTPEARARATSLLHFIAATFGATQYGHLSRLRLGQGFPALHAESPVVPASPAPGAAPSSAPSEPPAAVPSPNVTAGASPAAEAPAGVASPSQNPRRLSMRRRRFRQACCDKIRDESGSRGIFSGLVGVSPSGKAGDFESSIRWFESSHPSHRTVTTREALDGLFAAWRTGDALRSGAHFALEGVYREAGRAPLAGREAIVEHFTKFFRDGPRYELYVDDTLVEGERAAVRYRFAVEGKDGVWRERPGCAFVTFADGTIAEWHEYEG